MTDYQPLSVRRGIRQPQVALEGVPSHLEHPLELWLQNAFGYNERNARPMNRGLMLTIALQTGVVLGSGSDLDHMWQITDQAKRDEDLFLDVLDATLSAQAGQNAAELRQILSLGGSAWTVAADGQRLELRVEDTSSAAFRAATSANDQASAELAEAWAMVYGRSPDASDAWDHAIKAVEAVLVPITVPAKARATLGDVLGQLKANASGWTFALQTSSLTVGQIETVEALLRMIWPNPDRHGGTGPSRTPSLGEAQAVVQIAVLVVQWARDGALAKK